VAVAIGIGWHLAEGVVPPSGIGPTEVLEGACRLVT